MKCPSCQSENTYEDGNLWVCPECSNEWTAQEAEAGEKKAADAATVKDSHGNALVTGDAVVVIKDLKIKGATSVVKVGTKVKNIRVDQNGEDGHNISGKIDGMGLINLK